MAKIAEQGRVVLKFYVDVGTDKCLEVWRYSWDYNESVNHLQMKSV